LRAHDEVKAFRLIEAGPQIDPGVEAQTGTASFARPPGSMG
jgi:hypothetical protein